MRAPQGLLTSVALVSLLLSACTSPEPSPAVNTDRTTTVAHTPSTPVPTEATTDSLVDPDLLGMQFSHATTAEEQTNCQHLSAEDLVQWTGRGGVFVAMPHIFMGHPQQKGHVVQHCYYATGADHGHISYTVRFHPEEKPQGLITKRHQGRSEELNTTLFEETIGEYAAGLQVAGGLGTAYTRLDVAAGLYEIVFSSTNPNADDARRELVTIAEQVYLRAKR